MTIHSFSPSAFLLFFLSLSTLPVFGQFLAPTTIYAEKVTNVGEVFPVDLDGDGDLDFVFPDAGKGVWIRNDGAAGMSDPIVFFNTFGRTVFRLKPAGDLNSDGKEEVLLYIVESNGSRKLSAFINDGAGNFNQEVVIWNGNLLNFYTTDIDLDGLQDLIFEEEIGVIQQDQYWYRNTGQGFYEFGSLIASGLRAISTVADLDGDGDGDVLALGNFTFGWAGWKENPGDGDFEFVQSQNAFYVGNDTVFGLTTFDMDNDGDPDAVVSQKGKISIFKNEGNAVFSPLLVLTDSLYPGIPLLAAIGDVDNDGWPDILFAQAGYFGWFRNDAGSGNFSPQPRSFPNLGDYTNPSDYSALRITDWNNDGWNDLIACVFAGTSVCLNDGTGRFDRPERIVPKIGAIYSSKSMDADGDGDADLFAISSGTNTGRQVNLFRNEGGGQFAHPETVTNEVNATEFVLEDFNGDTLPDLLTTTGEIAVFLNLGNGTFGPRIFLDTIGTFQAVDLDNDGYPDVAVKSSYTGGAFYSKGNGWYKNDGTGHFGSFIPMPVDPFDQYADLRFADFNNDSLTDIYAFSGPTDVALYINSGNANFGPRQIIGTYSWSPLEIADFNNDHIPDILSGGNIQNIVWSPGTAQGTLGTPQILYTFTDPVEYFGDWEIGDFDKDGDIDLLFSMFLNVSSTYEFRLVWWENDGSGNFTKHVNPIRDAYAGTLHVADVNTDGFPDVVQSVSSNGLGSDYGSLVWLKNYIMAPYISGYCFHDANENEQVDSLEAFLRNIRLVLEPSAPSVFSEADGTFRFYVEPGDYTLSYVPSDCWERTTDSAEYHLQFADSLVAGLAFGFKTTTDTAFAGVFVTGAPARCNAVMPFWVNLFNRSCNPAAGQVAILPNALLTFVSAEPMPDTIRGDTLFWSFNALQPTEFQKIQVLFEVAGFQFTGDTTTLDAWVYSGPVSGVPILTGNAVWSEEIGCAIDPNDKLVQRFLLPVDYVAAENELLYTVRFQNTGNDTAYQVVIRDQLDATLDWQTFTPLGSSHPYRAELDVTTGEAAFTFEDIFLPDSNINQVASHGFVQFSILPKADLAPGTILPNSAGIYFDFNPPVLTNSVETRVQLPLQTSQPKEGCSVSIYPNPNAGTFLVRLPAAGAAGMAFQIVGLMGQVLREQPMQAGAMVQTVQASDLPAGLYFLRVLNEGKLLTVEKFVKQ